MLAQEGSESHARRNKPMDHKTTQSQTQGNQAFVASMLGEKKRLEDYPDRVDPDIVMHEPMSLPFGGTYRGLEDFKRFYDKVRKFYDFDTWQFVDVVAERDVVFSTSRVRIAGRSQTMHIAERFQFSGTTLVEVRVFICEASD
jgi:hypothetical protein